MNDKVKELQEIIQKQRKASSPVQVVKEVPKAAELHDETEKAEPAMRALMVICEGKLLYKAPILNYYVLGDLSQNLSTMQVTLLVTEEGGSTKKTRYKLDLYEKQQCREFCFEMSNLFDSGEGAIMKELLELTDLLEEFREVQVVAQHPIQKRQESPMVPTQERDAIEFLNEPGLMKRLDILLEQAGVMGNARLLMYMAGSSYKNREPLHLKITGNHESAANLMRCVRRCIPPEDVVELISISARSLFHCTNNELLNKSLFLPGILERRALQALKQLQEYGSLSTAVSIKDRLSNIVSAIKTVKSHFSSVVYGNAGEQNAKAIVISADESLNSKTMQYNNRKIAGLIDEEQENKARELLCNIIRCIEPMQAINPYADKIDLPVPASVKAQMSKIYNSLVIQVCLFSQRQRKADTKSRLIAEVEDLRIAGTLLFDAMVMETDELEPQVRAFYEGVKVFAKKLNGKSKFTLRELRHELGISKTYCFRYMAELIRMEYVKRTGHKNRGFHYSVIYFDDTDKVRERIKNELEAQFKKLGTARSKSQHESPDALAAKAYDGGDLKLPPVILNEQEHKYTPEE